MIRTAIITFTFCVVLPALLWMAMSTAWHTHYGADPNHAGAGCMERADRPMSEPC